ncbi:hexitol phosphatase HxpB [Vibrio fluvialis]|uniref:hexitol phosphatase HxpB n=1 Tax=Vibrio fluvialis TaxID=676 RepID=UPI0025745200|nr:hexitol phosphatase HxpB [Vibrio fluvialis]BEI22784.1 hexitol phosphatase HxpB [Vibrio fluvialis]
MNKKKAIIFDMDGVLIDSEPLWQAAQIESLSSLGVTITSYDCERLTMGKRIDELVRTWCDEYVLSTTQQELEERIISNLCKRIRSTGQAMNGVQDALAYFANQGFRIALATSSSHVVIRAVFERLQLWDKFELICSAEDEVHGKPHPDVYLTAARKLNLDVTECLVIEDSFTGLTAAKRANITTYLVSPHCDNEQFCIADGHFNNLNALLDSMQ